MGRVIPMFLDYRYDFSGLSMWWEKLGSFFLYTFGLFLNQMISFKKIEILVNIFDYNKLK